VVRVLNFFQAHDTVYMVMAYESGHSLQEHISRLHAKGSKPGEAFIRQIFIGVCSGLREVHANKLLHLDLKPANIFVRTDGVPILLDFGAARQSFNNELPKVTPMYTPGFAPTELYSKTGSLGPWSDIYSIGAAMYACMAGSPPQPADQRKVEDKMPANYARIEGNYSPALIKLVQWCLEPDPLARPQSLFALQKVLQEKVAPMPQLAPKAAGFGQQLRSLVARVGAMAGKKADKNS
jgi:serine/threonine protein kinase